MSSEADDLAESAVVLGPSAVDSFRADRENWGHSLPPLVLTPETVEKTAGDDDTVLGVAYNTGWSDVVTAEGELYESGRERLSEGVVPVVERVHVDALSDRLVEKDHGSLNPDPRERFADHLDADDQVALDPVPGFFALDDDSTTAEADEPPRFDGLSPAQTTSIVVADALGVPVVTNSRTMYEELGNRGVDRVSVLGAVFAGSRADAPRRSVASVLESAPSRDDALTTKDVAEQIEGADELGYDHGSLVTAFQRAAIAHHSDDLGPNDVVGADTDELDLSVGTHSDVRSAIERLSAEVALVDPMGVDAWAGEEEVETTSITRDHDGGQGR